MTKGVIAGNFDIIHPGYIYMFDECAKNCDEFIVLLHVDPSIERPEKLKPILTIEERIHVLGSLKQIDNICTYKTEAELHKLLRNINPDVRFLGDDYMEKSFTGDDLNIPIHWITRDHGWSTTKFKTLIANTLK